MAFSGVCITHAIMSESIVDMEKKELDMDGDGTGTEMRHRARGQAKRWLGERNWSCRGEEAVEKDWSQSHYFIWCKHMNDIGCSS